MPAAASASAAQPPPPRPTPANANASAPARTQAVVMAAGAVSGVVEGLSIQPLELVKTRAQIHEGKEPLRLLPTLRAIVRGDGGATQGGLRQLYRGALPEIVGLAPRASAALTTLEMAQRTFRERDPAGRLSPAAAHAAGGLSGASEAVAFAPFQVVKVRMMAREHLGRYRDSWDCLRQVRCFEREGVGSVVPALAPVSPHPPSSLAPSQPPTPTTTTDPARRGRPRAGHRPGPDPLAQLRLELDLLRHHAPPRAAL
jgi:solute carrier family 25 2-oxodicarboxylate transporter 21